MRVGLDGTAILKPGDDGNLNFGPPLTFPFSINNTMNDDVIYDEVTEENLGEIITIDIIDTSIDTEN